MPPDTGAECVVLGNFTDEVTVLGVGVQIVAGIFDAVAL